MQAEFGAPPQHIFSGQCPFFFDEPVEFALAEPISEPAAEVLGAACGSEDAPGITAIAVRKPQRRSSAEEGISAPRRRRRRSV
jgi:hypothetical protein